ncbi:hypothetical protein EG327_006340 [Venturia inaequalis]|uniref:Uncharacterized protein n=1 Tax=Venturia inaequalis TaxID=5025 RepID=A0A8H3Z6A1_VENIN|nr:hypothetical protein EG327_006340 [Venturia inaequalis]
MFRSRTRNANILEHSTQDMAVPRKPRTLRTSCMQQVLHQTDTRTEENPRSPRGTAVTILDDGDSAVCLRIPRFDTAAQHDFVVVLIAA